MSLRIVLGLMILILVVATGNLDQSQVQTLFVDRLANGGTHDGTTWCTAFVNLQDALSAARNSMLPVEIRIAAGRYSPDQGIQQAAGDRQASFDLSPDVQLLGGFAGCGATNPDERNPAVFLTILSGDLGADDGTAFANRSDNSYHVVTSRDSASNALIDGIVISGGNAQTSADGYGGGMLCENSNITIRSCVIRDNQAGLGGAGIYDCDGPIMDTVIEDNNAGLGVGGGMMQCDDQVKGCVFRRNSARFGAGAYRCDALFLDSEFSGNSAQASGGALASCKGSIQKCVIFGNSAGNSGGGLYDCQVEVTSCSITGNRASIYGGGVSDTSYPISNCVIAGNSAQIGGGGLWSCNGPVTNCTIVANRTTAVQQGGAIGQCNGGFTNCIFWENSNPYWADSYPYPTYSCAPGLDFEIGNTAEDPRIVDLGRFVGASQWADGDYRIHFDSPCVDSGDAVATTSAGLSQDLRGFRRVYDAPNRPNVGSDLSAPVDMGAVEYGDCDGDAIPDIDEIQTGQASDCNANNIPDLCIALEIDCNANAMPDACDIAQGADDCTQNGVPDSCELDCDGNGEADSCDIQDGVSSDCNANLIPDACDIMSGFSTDQVPPGGDEVPDECQSDCNANGVVDFLDISDGTASDCDENSIPDSCQLILSADSANLVNSHASTDSGGDYSPRIVADGLGNLVTLWYATSEPNISLADDFDIYFSRSTDGGHSWSTAALLVAGMGADPLAHFGPCVATNGNGTLVAAWTVQDRSGDYSFENQILVSRSTDGGVSWSAPQAITPYDYPEKWYLELVGDRNGVFLLSWSTGPGGGERSWVSRSLDGGATWSTAREFELNARGREPHIATDGAGTWLAVWFRYGVGIWDTVLSRSVDNGLMWTTTLLAGGVGIQIDPRIATDRAGHWVVVYRSDRLPDGSNSDLEVLTTHSTDNGASWSAPQVLNTDADQESDADDLPYVWTDGQGYWVAAWNRTGRMYTATSTTNGATWSAPQLLSGSSYSLDFAALGKGDWVGVWSSSENPGGLTGVDSDILVTMLTTAGDCNGTGELDACDIQSGVSLDCDADGMPDECSPMVDCNGNGVRDECETANGASADCSRNGVPDECEPDCNGNTLADSCDIQSGIAADCNLNESPDDCDLASGNSFDDSPLGGDGIPDECQGIIRFPHPRYSTIQTAMNDTPEGGAVWLMPGTYTGSGNRDLQLSGKNMVIRCMGPAGSCVLDCAGVGRGFDITGSTIGPETVVEGMKVINGYGVNDGGGMSICRASPLIRYCRFERCFANGYYGGDGGGVSVSGAESRPVFVGCFFGDNEAISGSGGGLSVYGTEVILDNCVFDSNRAYQGAGLISTAQATRLTRCSFVHNTTVGQYPGDGGGFWIRFGAILDRCVFRANRAGEGAGGLFYQDTSALVTNCQFLENQTMGTGYGGGLSNRGLSLVLKNSLFSRNSARRYAAVSTGGTAVVQGCTFVANTAPSGQVLGGSQSIAITNSILWGNTSGPPLQGAFIQASYSLVQGGWPGVGNLDTDPRFSDTGLDKYHLRLNSPCVDAGKPDSDATPAEQDIDGQPRRNGRRVDIGADEYYRWYVFFAQPFDDLVRALRTALTDANSTKEPRRTASRRSIDVKVSD